MRSTPSTILKLFLVASCTQVAVILKGWHSTTSFLTNLGGQHNLQSLPQPNRVTTVDFAQDDSSLRQVHDYAASIAIAWKELDEGRMIMLHRACPRHTPLDPRQQVTMAVHAGPSKFSRLLFSIRRWAGPVSASVYVTSGEEVGQLLRLCTQHSDLAQTDIHVLMEKPSPSDDEDLEYPHNRLRQAALNWIPTDYFLTLDVDFVTPPNASHNLDQLLATDADLVDHLQDKHWMVLPAFDGQVPIPDEDLLSNPVAVDKVLPRNKVEAQAFVAKEIVSPFHVDLFPMGHGPTNFTKWFDTKYPLPPEQRNQLGSFSSFYVIDYGLKFEPYILGYKSGDKGFPKYWPGFRGFGFNKWTWLAESYFSGYQFAVLTCPTCFITHIHHPLRKNLDPNYVEYDRWMKHMRRHFGWPKDKAYEIFADKSKFQEQETIGPEGIPRLLSWSVKNGSVQGRIYNSKINLDREYIGTSKIVEGEVKAGNVVIVASGQQYYLSDQTIEWEESDSAEE